MQFEKFPCEVQAAIIRCLGPSFFKQDVRFLHVSKFWYHVAWPVMFSDLRLTPSSLVRLANNQARLERHVKYAKTVRLCLIEDRLIYLKLKGPFEADDDLLVKVLRQCGVDTYALTEIIDNSLQALTVAMKKFAVVKNIHFMAGQRPSAYWKDSRDELSPATVDMFLSASLNLTTLTFDMLDYQPTFGAGDCSWHPCQVINSLLPSLKRLRFRSDTTCAELLDVSRIESVALEEVIIVLMTPSPQNDWRGYCNDTNFQNLDSLQYKVRRQAVALAAQAPIATQIRVVTCHPNSKTYAFDAITGVRSKLTYVGEYACWENWQKPGRILQEHDFSDQVGFRNHLRTN